MMVTSTTAFTGRMSLNLSLSLSLTHTHTHAHTHTRTHTHTHRTRNVWKMKMRLIYVKSWMALSHALARLALSQQISLVVGLKFLVSYTVLRTKCLISHALTYTHNLWVCVRVFAKAGPSVRRLRRWWRCRKKSIQNSRAHVNNIMPRAREKCLLLLKCLYTVCT